MVETVLLLPMELLLEQTTPSYFHSLRTDVLASLSRLVTFATAISKSSCVTCMRFSRIANMPASVHTAYARSPLRTQPCTPHRWHRSASTQSSSGQFRASDSSFCCGSEGSEAGPISHPHRTPPPPRSGSGTRSCDRCGRAGAARGPECQCGWWP